jgi:hypothetical protein
MNIFENLCGMIRRITNSVDFRLSPAREKRRKRQKPFPSRVARTGIEPATQGFSVLCSTD